MAVTYLGDVNREGCTACSLPVSWLTGNLATGTKSVVLGTASRATATCLQLALSFRSQSIEYKRPTQNQYPVTDA
jgi:hypothetical protein